MVAAERKFLLRPFEFQHKEEPLDKTYSVVTSWNINEETMFLLQFTVGDVPI